MIASILIAFCTISSDRLWSFMNKPTGFDYPDYVSSEHTFGSPDHTNASRRVVKEDLAAIETLFEAYYERVFFASEGLSNNWDVAEYGPQVRTDADLARMNFTTNSGNISLHYKPESRTMPGTMRFAETNLVPQTDWNPGGILSVYYDLFDRSCGDANVLGRGGTWQTQNRRVWWACSKFDYAEMPESFDWHRNGWPSGHSFVSNFVPVAAFDCQGHTFPGTQGNATHFAWDLLYPVMQRPEDLETAMGDRYYADYSFVGTNSIFRQLNKVFGCSEELYYDDFTQRLAPDEYVTVITSVEEEFVDTLFAAYTDEAMASFMSWSPWFGISDMSPGEVRNVATGISQGGGRVVVNSYGKLNLPVFDYESTHELRLEMKMDDARDLGVEFAMINESVQTASYTAWADNSGNVTNGVWSYIWPGFSFDAYRYILVTNSFVTNVSCLAGAARIAAVHDRTMEIPFVSDAHIAVSNRIDDCSRWSFYSKQGTFPISVDVGTMTFRFGSPVRLSGLDYGDGEISSTNIVSYAPQEDQTIDCAYFDGAHASGRASFSASRASDACVGVVGRDDIPQNPAFAGEEHYAGIYREYDPITDVFTYGYTVFVPYYFVIKNASSFCNLEEIDSIPGEARFEANGSARAERTSHPANTAAFRRLFPAYTPGVRGASRVKSANCIFAASAVFDWGYHGVVWRPPFDWSMIEYSHHDGRVDYAFDVQQTSSWNALSTFPSAYASMRQKVLSRLSGEVFPDSLPGCIPVDIGSYDISGLSAEAEGGTLELRFGTDPSQGAVYIVYDENGKCAGFRYPGDPTGAPLHESFTSSMYYFLYAECGEAPDLTVPLQAPRSATGRTSGAIVADWDFHALKLERNNQ